MPTEASVKRYLRRHIHKSEFDVFISCLPGFEDDTAGELVQMFPGQFPIVHQGGLSVKATLADIYRMNLSLSTANRVLLRLGTFDAWSFPMLLDHASRVHWPAFIPDPSLVDIRVTAKGSRLNLKQRIRDVFERAIAHAFEDFDGANRGCASAVFVRISGDSVSVSLDTSGEHLHKRGTKVATGTAPIRSTLVSAALSRVCDADTRVVCDPFCGSGTVLVEALRMAIGIAPGGQRQFAFMDHPYFRAGTWRQVLRDDAAERTPSPFVRIVGGDVQKSAVSATLSNATSVGNPQNVDVDVQVLDFERTLDRAITRSTRGVVVTNPPFGKRVLTSECAEDLHTRFALRLERLPEEWAFAIFVQKPEIYERARNIRIVRSDKISVGGLPVYLIQGVSRSGTSNKKSPWPKKPGATSNSGV